MQTYDVDGLTFEFLASWNVGKYDTWSFYRNRFIKVANEIKALDLLAVSPERTAWLLEVKDYRVHQRTKPSELANEVVKKVVDTLAAILPVKINGDVASETALATAVAKALKFRVVLHLEQPRKHSKLFPRVIDPADIEMKLRQRLKPIDAHPLVAETSNMRSLPWMVS